MQKLRSWLSSGNAWRVIMVIGVCRKLKKCKRHLLILKPANQYKENLKSLIWYQDRKKSMILEIKKIIGRYSREILFSSSKFSFRIKIIEERECIVKKTLLIEERSYQIKKKVASVCKRSTVLMADTSRHWATAVTKGGLIIYMDRLMSLTF